MDEQKHQLNVILKRLMVECNVDDLRLANLTGVPFATIARMRSNPKANPTVASLRPLAKNFGVSISQLLGDEPLAPDRLTKAMREENSIPTRLPMIPWNKIINWMFNDKSTFKDIVGWMSVDLPVSMSGYVVRIKNLGCGHPFSEDAVLVIDPKVSPQSGDTVLIKVNNDPNILLKEMIFDDKIVYLKSVNPELKHTMMLSEPYTLCGTVVEVRKILHTESFSNLKHYSKQPVERVAA